MFKIGETIKKVEKAKALLFKYLGILIISAGILLAMFFFFYKGHKLEIPSWLGLPMGVAIAATGIKLFEKSTKMHEAEIVDEISKDYLKQKGNKTIVNLIECEILQGEEAKELYKKQGFSEFYDEEVFDKKWARVNTGVLTPICIKFRDTNNIFVSPLIYMEKEELKNVMQEKGETTLYTHKKDKDIFYFDLEFLLKN